MIEQAVPGLIIGVIVALASAFASHLLVRRRDRELWERENEAQRERWEREDRLRFQAERMGAYRDFLVGAQQALDSVAEGTEFFVFDADRMAPLLQEIKLIASNEVAEAAAALFRDGSYTNYMRQQWRGDMVPTPSLHEAKLKFEASYSKFTNVARAELGISEEPLEL